MQSIYMLIKMALNPQPTQYYTECLQDQTRAYSFFHIEVNGIFHNFNTSLVLYANETCLIVEPPDPNNIKIY